MHLLRVAISLLCFGIVVPGPAFSASTNKDNTTNAVSSKSAKQDKGSPEKDKAAGSGEQRPAAPADNPPAGTSAPLKQFIPVGLLMTSDVEQICSMHSDIARLEYLLEAPGLVTKDNAGELHALINGTAYLLFVRGRDANGDPVSVYRLGRDVVLKNEFASTLQSRTMSRKDAAAIAGDLALMLTLKAHLSSVDLNPPERTKAQAQYNTLLNKYFERKPVPTR